MNSRRTPFTASGESEILDLEGDMYLGGLPENRAGLILPTELWTAMLNYGYVGCIRDLFIDGRSKNIRQLAEMQNAAGVKSSCSRMSAKQCDSYPCKNNAVCKDGWNRFICDCTGTGYWGRTCERGESCGDALGESGETYLGSLCYRGHFLWTSLCLRASGGEFSWVHCFPYDTFSRSGCLF